MANDIHRDIAFAGHCVAAVLVAAWRLGFTEALPGPPPGAWERCWRASNAFRRTGSCCGDVDESRG